MEPITTEAQPSILQYYISHESFYRKVPSAFRI